jgi:uncharacterized protein, YigZ family
MRENYRTVKNRSEISWEINKSQFIARIARTETAEQAHAFVEEIRTKHADATHNCFACIAGIRDEFQKADDDGEPTGTAGKPILEVIKKNNLKDTTIVVTRYFGGIKLGAGGLIRAYGKSASTVIKAAEVIERTLNSRIRISIEYPLLGLVENQLHSRGYTITDKQFTQRVALFVLETAGKENRLRELVTEWTAGTALFSEEGRAYKDVTVKLT